MGQPTVVEAGSRLNLTSTGTIGGTGQFGKLMGVFVAQASGSMTLQISDSQGNIANTFSPLAGTYYPLPCYWFGTLTITITGTGDCTVFYDI